jgi:MipA family protein
LKPVLFACAAVLGAAASSSALAQPTGVTFFGYDVNASLRARVGPTYEGSDDYGIGPAGGISLSKPGSKDLFSAPDDSASLSLFGDDRFSVGLAGRLRSGRDDDDDLRGMKKIDWGGEAGVFANLWVADWLRARVEVRKGFGGHDGVIVDVGADAVASGDRWTVAAGPRFSWADDEFTQTYFGVTPGEALASPYIASAYDAKGGPRYVGAVASADYKWTERWGLTFDVGYRRLLGDAADSPLVAGLGSENQFSASAGVRYALGR